MPRVKITLDSKNTQYGEFLGLIQDENGDTRVIVRVDGQGLQLTSARPYTVEFVPDSETVPDIENLMKNVKAAWRDYYFNEKPTLSTEQIKDFIYNKNRKD